MKPSWRVGWLALALMVACGDRREAGESPASGLSQAPPVGSQGAASSEPPAAPGPAMEVSVDPSSGQLSAMVDLPPLPVRGGLDPQVSLVYGGSTRDFGEGLGAGFSLSVPSITTSEEYGLTLVQFPEEKDPLVTPLTYQGTRLMPVGKSVSGGAEVLVYRPEVGEEAVRVYYHRTPGPVALLGKQLSFQGFEVVLADGSRELYTEEASVAEYDTFSATGERTDVTTRFPLRYRVGPSGDYVEYEYEQNEVDRRTYLRAVSFAGGRSRYELELTPVPNAAERPVFDQGFEQRQTHVYTRIVSKFDGRAVQRWYLVYRTSDGESAQLFTAAEASAIASREFPLPVSGAPLSEESVLVGVLRYGGGTEPLEETVRLAPLGFTYADRTLKDLQTQTEVRTISLGGVSGFGPSQGAEYVDLNQDGLVDVLSTQPSATKTSVYLNSGRVEDGSFLPEEAPLTVTRAGASGTWVPNFRGGTTGAWLPGDFDGDGIGDLLQIEPRSGGDAGSLLTLYAGRVGQKSLSPSLGSVASARAIRDFTEGRAQAVDVNADGRDDLLISERNDSGDWSFSVLLNVTRSLGKPEGGKLSLMDLAKAFEAPALFNDARMRGVEFALSAAENRLMDVNGDGLTDLTVVRANAASAIGVCVFENRGAVRANVDFPDFSSAKSMVLFGDGSSGTGTCPGGYFVEIPNLRSITTVNALWLIDVTGDGLSDLVNVSSQNDRLLSVWIGRGRAGFRAAGEIRLESPLPVDAVNRWNTRVLDFDGDGQEEIVVYENARSEGGERLHVVDFNRLAHKTLTPPLLMTQAREGKGIRHLVQYATSTDELLRDRELGAADTAGVPLVMPVVKRLLTQVAEAPTGVTEYRYHAATPNLVERGFLGFGEVEVVSYGDAQTEHALSRVSFDVAGDGFRSRAFGELERSRTSYGLASDGTIDALLASFDALSRDAPPSLSFVAQTSETRAERALSPSGRRASRRVEWASDVTPSGERDALYLRQKEVVSTTYGSTCGSDACEGATVARVVEKFDACNRVEQERLVEGAVAGPKRTSLAERRREVSTLYQVSCAQASERPEAHLPLTTPRRVATRSLASGRLLQQTDYTYEQTPFAPSSVTSRGSVDKTGVPPALAARVEELAPESVRHGYDDYLNPTTVHDNAGVDGGSVLVERSEYEADGVRRKMTVNALGHAQTWHYTPGWVEATTIDTPRGDTIQLTYDALQRIRTSERRDGSKVSYEYREADPIATRRVLVTESRTALERNQTLYVQRADGLPVVRIEPGEDGRARVLDHVQYGRRGDVVREAVPALEATPIPAMFAASTEPSWLPSRAACPSADVACTSYDALGRRVAYVAAAGRYQEAVRQEAWGQHIEVTDDGENRSSDRVERGDLVHALVDELGEVHRFERDEADQIQAIHLAGGDQAREVRSDSLGRVLYASVPFGMSKIFVRDVRGRVVREEIYDRAQRPGGYLTTVYDALDRPRDSKSFVVRGAAPVLTDTFSWTYDEQPEGSTGDVGTLVHAKAVDELAKSSFEESFAHDLDGRVTARHASYTSGPLTRSYEAEKWVYRLDGELEQYTDPFGNRFAYEVLGSGRVGAVTWHHGTSTGVLVKATTFDAFGQPMTLERPLHQLREVRDYDRAHGLLLSRRACADRGGCAFEDTWKRRGDGRVIGRRSRDPARGAEVESVYAYSLRGELEHARIGDRRYAYKADVAGHLLQCDELEVASFARHESPVALPAGQRPDDFGRVLRGAAAHDLVYDASGRLRAVTLENKQLSYSYSALGERIARRESDGQVAVYPSPQTRDDGSERQSLVDHEGQPLALIVNERESLALITDHLGVVEGLVGGDGATVASWRFSPYGRLEPGAPSGVAGLSSLELVRSFTGSLRDEDTELVHMGEREYLANVASFTTPDPLFYRDPGLCTESALECAPYGYVAHDPLNYVDPDGTVKSSKPASVKKGLQSRFKRLAKKLKAKVTRLVKRFTSNRRDDGLQGTALVDHLTATRASGGGAWRAPRTTSDPKHARLTNGPYTLDAKGMAPHTTGSLAGGKSQFLSQVNEGRLVLDAAAYADHAGLWQGSKAKVVTNVPIGVHARTGALTKVLNIYRNKNGFVHGAPGRPSP